MFQNTKSSIAECVQAEVALRADLTKSSGRDDLDASGSNREASSGRWIGRLAAFAVIALSFTVPVWSQEAGESAPTAAGDQAPKADNNAASDSPANDDSRASAETRTGYLIDVPPNLDGEAATRIVTRLERWAARTREGNRTTVLVRIVTPETGNDETTFESALTVARALGQPELRGLRVVAFVDGDVSGHRLLIALAAEQILVAADGAVGVAITGDAGVDETVVLTYQSIAKRRGLVPPAIVTAMLDRDAELVQLALINGQQRLATGEELREARAAGEILSEEVWKAPGTALRLSPKQLRDARVVAGVVDSTQQAADMLDVAEWTSSEQAGALDTPSGVLIEIKGSITSARARRWQSNLVASLQSGETNTWFVELDSSGGDFDTSATLAGTFSSPTPPLQTVAGVVSGEVRGDAALIAIACRPLMMTPEGRLGGPGAQSLRAVDLRRYDELISQIAADNNRPEALIRGLLVPTVEVYRFTDRRTGRVRYATTEEIESEVGDVAADDAALQRWERGERIDLSEGLTGAQAIALGLADAEVETLEAAARQIGLDRVPAAMADRPIIRWVERLGRNDGLMFLLLLVGFFTLSAEAGVPGLGVPGFISLLCFSLFFWMKFLAGTAEWLELIMLTLGLTCIAIEIFIVPGVGIFGIGGLVLTVIGVVLMSQTFVIPQNSYQVEVLTRGIWLALGGVGGMVGGFLLIRTVMPHVPLLSDLVMETPDHEAVERHERLADYNHLLGQTGVATTMLRPAGKAKFGETIVAVLSDGTPLAAGDAVRVREVHGNRIVVEAIES